MADVGTASTVNTRRTRVNVKFRYSIDDRTYYIMLDNFDWDTSPHVHRTDSGTDSRGNRLSADLRNDGVLLQIRIPRCIMKSATVIPTITSDDIHCVLVFGPSGHSGPGGQSGPNGYATPGVILYTVTAGVHFTCSRGLIRRVFIDKKLLK